MKLAEYEHCYLIKDFFSPEVAAGFSKSNLAGNPLEDINPALSFLEKKPKLSYLKQVHSSQVIFAAREGLYTGDALFSREKSLVLVVRTADCLPLFFASKKLGIMGVVHMGWRSAKAGILDNITYDLESFKVVCGAGLRKCCYQVGDEFLSYAPFKGFIEKKKVGARHAVPLHCFDPVSFARGQLCRKGLKADNFLDLGLCSFCSSKSFFSYRRDKTASRTLSFICKM